MFMHVGDALRLRGDTVMRNQVPHDRVRDFEYQKQGLSSWRACAGDSVGKECVAFLKRAMMARQLAGEFRSRWEYLRASDLLAGLHRRGASSELVVDVRRCR
jgi:hypothetical protein